MVKKAQINAWLSIEGWKRSWRRDLKAIGEDFSEEVTFKLDFEGWRGVHQLDNIERTVQGKAEMNEWINEQMNEFMERTI